MEKEKFARKSPAIKINAFGESVLKAKLNNSRRLEIGGKRSVNLNVLNKNNHKK